MRRGILLCLAVCLCLTGCSGTAADLATGWDAALTELSQQMYYTFDTMEAKERFTAGDGTELAFYSYQLLTMSAAETEDLPSTVRETVERTVEKFNRRMIQLLDDSVAQGRAMGDAALAAYQEGSQALEYSDETVSDAVVQGQIISVRTDNSSFTGGAHPNSYTRSYTFDLAAGQFIDPIQVADDPDAFRTGMGELLVEKAEERREDLDLYWADYRDIVSRWNEAAVVFDEEGVTVIYSPYELGPYVLGAVELFASYEELADLLGPGGLNHLNVNVGEA